MHFKWDHTSPQLNAVTITAENGMERESLEEFRRLFLEPGQATFLFVKPYSGGLMTFLLMDQAHEGILQALKAICGDEAVN